MRTKPFTNPYQRYAKENSIQKEVVVCSPAHLGCSSPTAAWDSRYRRAFLPTGHRFQWWASHASAVQRVAVRHKLSALATAIERGMPFYGTVDVGGLFFAGKRGISLCMMPISGIWSRVHLVEMSLLISLYRPRWCICLYLIIGSTWLGMSPLINHTAAELICIHSTAGVTPGTTSRGLYMCS
jgi:hypothetical protein